MGKGGNPNCQTAAPAMNSMLGFAAAKTSKKTKVSEIMSVVNPEDLDAIEGVEAPEAPDLTIDPKDLEPITRPNGDEYFPRHLAPTGMTDIQVLRKAREAETPVLLGGYPGCGKTAMIEAAFGEDLYTVEGNGELEVTDLVGSWKPIKEDTLRVKMAQEIAEEKELSEEDTTLVLEAAKQLPKWGGPPQPVNGPAGELIAALEMSQAPDGSLLIAAPEDNLAAQALLESWRRAGNASEYEWEDGPLVKAMKEGKPLFVDDITMIPAPVLLRLYSAMDGRKVLRLTEHEGEEIHAQPGFVVVGAHNPDAPGAVLSEALASRFALQPTVASNLSLAVEMGVNRRVVKAAVKLRARREEGQITWAPEMRELLAFRDVAAIVGETAAASNMLESAPPDSRDAVYEVLWKIFPDIADFRVGD